MEPPDKPPPAPPLALALGLLGLLCATPMMLPAAHAADVVPDEAPDTPEQQGAADLTAVAQLSHGDTSNTNRSQNASRTLNYWRNKRHECSADFSCGPSQICDQESRLCVPNPDNCEALRLMTCDCRFVVRQCYCDMSLDIDSCFPDKQFCARVCSGHDFPSILPSGSFFVVALPLLVGAGTCFVVALATTCICRIMVRRYVRFGVPDDRSVGDGDGDSVSSMQRWINERRRENPPPPRYEERYGGPPPTESEAPVTPAADAAVTPATGTATAPAKPPSYEATVNENLRPLQPPPYSAVVLLVPEEGHAAGISEGISNPVFVGDSEQAANEEPRPEAAAAAAAAPQTSETVCIAVSRDRESIS